MHDVRGARDAIRHGDAVLSRLPGHPALEAWLAEDKAIVALNEGRYEDAIKFEQHSLDLRQQIHGRSHYECRPRSTTSRPTCTAPRTRRSIARSRPGSGRIGWGLAGGSLGIANGTQLALNVCQAGSRSQQWSISADGPTGAFIFKNAASGRCLNESGSNTAAGVPMQIWDCNGGSNQKFAVQAY